MTRILLIDVEGVFAMVGTSSFIHSFIQDLLLIFCDRNQISSHARVSDMMAKKKILVIDDEEILTKTFARLLEKSGYEVFLCKTGSDAVEVVQEESFDLIICDIRMPGMDGIETIKKIRDILRDKGQVRPPDVFVTGYADEITEKKARALNPAAYIEKPFDNVNLLNKVRELIGT